VIDDADRVTTSQLMAYLAERQKARPPIE